MNAVETMLKVAEIGGRLEAAGPEMLRMYLPADAPQALKDEIGQNKPALLAILLGPPFLIVRAEALQGETLFWTATAAGRDLLIAHGASHGSVYNFGELNTVVGLNPDPKQLRQICHAKRLFDGRIRPPMTSVPVTPITDAIPNNVVQTNAVKRSQ
jgi:hypothetical protein